MACDRWDRWASFPKHVLHPSSRLEPCLALIRGCACREDMMQANALGGYRYPSGNLTRCRHAGGIGGRESRAERRGLRGEGEARGIGVRDPHPSPLSLAPRPSPLAFIQAVARFDPVRPNEGISVQMAKCHRQYCAITPPNGDVAVLVVEENEARLRSPRWRHCFQPPGYYLGSLGTGAAYYAQPVALVRR